MTEVKPAARGQALSDEGSLSPAVPIATLVQNLFPATPAELHILTNKALAIRIAAAFMVAEAGARGLSTLDEPTGLEIVKRLPMLKVRSAATAAMGVALSEIGKGDLENAGALIRQHLMREDYFVARRDLARAAQIAVKEYQQQVARAGGDAMVAKAKETDQKVSDLWTRYEAEPERHRIKKHIAPELGISVRTTQNIVKRLGLRRKKEKAKKP